MGNPQDTEQPKGSGSTLNFAVTTLLFAIGNVMAF